MGMVTETTAAGDVRLRIVVSKVVWDRILAVSAAMGIEDREVLLAGLGLGVRYLDLVVNPPQRELAAVYEAHLQQEVESGSSKVKDDQETET
jgi:hypothetical protein